MVVGLVYGWMIKKSISSEWYRNLKKPCFHPPGWIIPVAFAAVNALIGYASSLICAIEESSYHYWHDSNEESSASETRVELSHLHKLAIIAYLIQFALNGIWPIIFFITENITLALFQIIIVDAATIFCVRLFFESSHQAGLLSLPYLAWLAVWTGLIFSLWIMNGDSSGAYEKLITKGTMTPHFMTQVSVTQLPGDALRVKVAQPAKSEDPSPRSTGQEDNAGDHNGPAEAEPENEKPEKESKSKRSRRRKEQNNSYYGSVMV